MKPGDLLPYYIGLYGRSEIESHAWLHDHCKDAWHNDWRANGMAFEHKNNHGSLFRNKDQKSDKSPTHTGTAKIFGSEVRIAAWVKEGRDGNKYFSLKFEPKDERPATESRATPADEIDDDLPF